MTLDFLCIPQREHDLVTRKLEASWWSVVCVPFDSFGVLLLIVYVIFIALDELCIDMFSVFSLALGVSSVLTCSVPYEL